jgi:hypothetical protein
MRANTLKVVKQLLGGFLVKDSRSLYLVIFTEKGDKYIDIGCNTETLPKMQINQFFETYSIIRIGDLELWLVGRGEELYLLGYTVVDAFESHLVYTKWLNPSTAQLTLPWSITQSEEISVGVSKENILKVLS